MFQITPKEHKPYVQTQTKNIIIFFKRVKKSVLTMETLNEANLSQSKERRHKLNEWYCISVKLKLVMSYHIIQKHDIIVRFNISNKNQVCIENISYT